MTRNDWFSAATAAAVATWFIAALCLSLWADGDGDVTTAGLAAAIWVTVGPLLVAGACLIKGLRS